MSDVAIETANRVQIVRLQRPQKKNALTLAMYAALAAALRDARESENVHAVLLAGTPGVFSAGNDIGDFMNRSEGDDAGPGFRFLEELASFPKPLVVAVDGLAIGIGTTLLLHSDLIIASTRSRFRLPFVNLGLVPEAGSSYLLPRLVGLQRASEWLLLGDFLSADDALKAGLVNAVVEPEQVEAEARAKAEALAQRPPQAVQLTKQLIRQPLQQALSEAMQREGAAFVERLQSPEAMEAFAAFLSKKAP